MDFRLDVRVEFDTPFNVGSGAMGGTWADKPLVKDRDGLPMIPASSLKGKLRHECERLAEALLEDEKPVCGSPAPDAMCQSDDLTDLCPACRIFGSPWHQSPLFFSDLRIVEPRFLREMEPPPRTNLRYGVGLSRHRRVAEEHLLYTTEVFQPGGTVTLAGSIEGRLDEKELALLIAGLDSVFALGGGKSRGLGWCHCQVQVWRIAENSTETELPLDNIRRRWEHAPDQA